MAHTTTELEFPDTATRAGQEVGIPDDVQAAMRALVAAQGRVMGAVANRRVKNDL